MTMARFKYGSLDFKNVESLKLAISRNQFKVHFQPQISIASLKPIGAEALVRYEIEEGKLLPPDSFIPLLENSGLISHIDFYVFDFVCSKIQEWMRENKQVIPIATNFSRLTLSTKGCCEKAIHISKQYQVCNSYLDIEITERLTSGSNSKLIYAISEMSNAGFSISIDDFGCNHSDFTIFSGVKVNTLKLDKSLVNELVTNYKKLNRVKSIIKMCKNMQVITVAEGVETQEQLNILSDLQCDRVQGYMFCMPLTYEDFKKKYVNI